MEVIILETCLAVFLAAFFLFFLSTRKKMRQKNQDIKALMKSISSLEKKLKGLERRSAHRLRLLTEQTCSFEIIEVGDKVLERLLFKKSVGVIKDISRTGLKMVNDVDLPVRKKIVVKITFELLDESFSLIGVIVRKQEEINGRVNYGLQFINMEMKEEQRLTSVINHLEMESRKTE